uniref:Uncharacterized protein n=1 Tax=Mola mola TaxID=94237 RepID=A0A3Q3VKQ2_MOLML
MAAWILLPRMGRHVIDVTSTELKDMTVFTVYGYQNMRTQYRNQRVICFLQGRIERPKACRGLLVPAQF